MLRLALKYSDQLSELNEIAERNLFLNDITELKILILSEEKEREQRLKENMEGAQVLTQILKYFDNVNIPTPEAGTAFSEKEFVESLKKRAEENKALTPKQGKVLARIAIGYKKEIDKFDELASLLSISTEEVQAAEKRNEKSSEQNPEIVKLLSSFDNFDSWNEPVKKGKRVFDDKAFYLSLRDQFKRKNSLSFKQVAALKKIIFKYFNNENKNN